MICKHCKKEIPNDAVLCPYCATPIKKETQKQKPEAKCWTVFGKVGHGLSLAGIICFWIPIIGLCLAIPGLVFSCLSKKSKSNIEYHENSYKMGLAGTILSGIVLIVGILLAIILPIVLIK